MKKITDKDLRDSGYLTIDEFVDAFTLGVREYLRKNWQQEEDNTLHHPEDLISSALNYTDAAYYVLSTFPPNKK